MEHAGFPAREARSMPTGLEAVATRAVDPNLWLGIRDVDHLEGGKKLSDAGVIAGLVTEVARFNPDLVLVGNLHAEGFYERCGFVTIGTVQTRFAPGLAMRRELTPGAH